MKWSRFIYQIDRENTIRIKSSKNLVTIDLDKEIYNEIDKTINDDLKEVEGVFASYINQLKEVELIVDDIVDEKKEFLEDISNAVEEINHEYTITIIPTMKCNFSCAYCYEEGTERINDMSEDTIDKFFLWIKNELILEHNVNKIHFKFFGGEPLYVKDELLNYIFNKIQELEIEYTTGIITNGFLLTNSKCDLLAKANMTYLQITLDGPREYHDCKRILKKGGETFDIIVSNLSRAIKKRVSQAYIIRVNCCKSNISLVPELLNYIAEKFNDSRDKIFFSFGLIGKSFNEDINKEIEDDSLQIDDGSLNQYASLYKHIKDLGFPYYNHYEISALCSNKISDSIIMQSDGNVIKCLRAVERTDFYETNIENMKILNRKANIELYNKCFEEGCPYISYCHLGCQYGYYIEAKRKKGRYCQREILDYINKQLLEIMY